MIRTALFLGVMVLALFVLAKNVRAQTECGDVYGLCTAGCANDHSPERCMQRCQSSRNRCSLSGSFAMEGAGLLRNHIPIDQSLRRELYHRPANYRKQNAK